MINKRDLKINHSNKQNKKTFQIMVKIYLQKNKKLIINIPLKKSILISNNRNIKLNKKLIYNNYQFLFNK